MPTSTMTYDVQSSGKRLAQAAGQVLRWPLGLLPVMGAVALVVGLAWLDKPANVRAVPKEVEDQSPSGGALYHQFCSKCHGADGRPTASKAKMPEIPDFTSPSWQMRRTDADLLAAILHGTGPRMPAYEDKLAARQARAVVAYVRTFGPKGAPVKSGATPDFESRWRELQRQWDDLNRQLENLSRSKSKR